MGLCQTTKHATHSPLNSSSCHCVGNKSSSSIASILHCKSSVKKFYSSALLILLLRVRSSVLLWSCGQNTCIACKPCIILAGVRWQYCTAREHISRLALAVLHCTRAYWQACSGSTALHESILAGVRWQYCTAREHFGRRAMAVLHCTRAFWQACAGSTALHESILAGVRWRYCTAREHFGRRAMEALRCTKHLTGVHCTRTSDRSALHENIWQECTAGEHLTEVHCTRTLCHLIGQ